MSYIENRGLLGQPLATHIQFLQSVLVYDYSFWGHGDQQNTHTYILIEKRTIFYFLV